MRVKEKIRIEDRDLGTNYKETTQVHSPISAVLKSKKLWKLKRGLFIFQDSFGCKTWIIMNSFIDFIPVSVNVQSFSSFWNTNLFDYRVLLPCSLEYYICMVYRPCYLYKFWIPKFIWPQGFHGRSYIPIVEVIRADVMTEKEKRKTTSKLILDVLLYFSM